MEIRYPVENLEDTRVEIYKNLRNGKWSIRAREGKYKGLVIAYADEMLLGGNEGVTFYVNESGRKRVNLKRRKEVHAVVRGKLVINESLLSNENFKEGISVYYDPYKTIFFQNRLTGEELKDKYDLIKFDRYGKVYIINN